MKLTEVRTANPVFDDAGQPVTFMREANGYTLSLEQGIVTIAHAKMTGGRIVPFAACSATPAPVKAGK